MGRGTGPGTGEVQDVDGTPLRPPRPGPDVGEPSARPPGPSRGPSPSATRLVRKTRFRGRPIAPTPDSHPPRLHTRLDGPDSGATSARHRRRLPPVKLKSKGVGLVGKGLRPDTRVSSLNVRDRRREAYSGSPVSCAQTLAGQGGPCLLGHWGRHVGRRTGASVRTHVTEGAAEEGPHA